MLAKKKYNSISKRKKIQLRNTLTWTTSMVLLITSLGYADLSDGLIVYYPFEGTPNDASGNGYHGMEYGGPSYESGIIGKAIRFSGYHMYVYCGDYSTFDFSELDSTFSIACWINFEGWSLNEVDSIVSKWSWPGNNRGWFMGMINKRLEMILTEEGYPVGIPPEYTIRLRTMAELNPYSWYHVCYVVDVSTDMFSIYVNGINQPTECISTETKIDAIHNNDAMLGIGSSNAYSDHFHGLIDEVRIYDRVLTAEEIKELVFGTYHVAIDIKPGSCPNPLNVKDKGMLPVAVLGTKDLDVFNIDPASVRLEGVAPIRSSYEDVATPVSNKTNDSGCITEGPDGYLDLVLKLNAQEIVSALGGVYDGDELLLTLTGEDINGVPIEGTDCVVIIAKGGK